ncbi:heme-dependent oxidative N-demethylase family protein [Dermatobacter hominis]|uniref:heme-dependent oxidative N-demethylase family protein n=1 Tax=Dermatobacter hominis TaxID=2884263 RepID=UPI001D12A53C|nr:DUF3445 domain-containing protein [Dermatobacter hominis]UDY34542.1 DUF3445 domain-containing protein [Dermatobacter hominis]
MDWQADAATGLPRHALAYEPDADLYVAMVDEHGPPAWLDELDLRPAPPTLHVGTHAGSTDEWLLADQARSMELALRSRLLDERRDVVFGALPGTDAAAEELLAEVTSWLRGHDIDHDPPDPDEHPLAAAGRLVQDDLCLMARRDGAWHLDAGVLAFPSHWRLHDRIGLPMPLVHEHVAHYDEIGDRVDRFFDRLPVGRVVRRRNLSVQPHPHLYCPTAKSEMRPDVHRVQPDGHPGF